MESQNKTYKIRVRTLEGNILTFSKVKKYSNQEGILTFIDSYTGKTKHFTLVNCEIEEEEK